MKNFIKIAAAAIAVLGLAFLTMKLIKPRKTHLRVPAPPTLGSAPEAGPPPVTPDTGLTLKELWSENIDLPVTRLSEGEDLRHVFYPGDRLKILLTISPFMTSPQQIEVMQGRSTLLQRELSEEEIKKSEAIVAIGLIADANNAGRQNLHFKLTTQGKESAEARLDIWLQSATLETWQKLLEPKYEEAYSFHHGFAAVRSGGKWTYINKWGRELFPPRYDGSEAYDFSEGYAVVRRGEKFTYLDTQGNESFGEYDEAHPFHEGWAVGRMEEIYIHLNANGKSAFRPNYQSLRGFSEGYAAAQSNGRWTFIDSRGRELFTPRYASVGDFHEGYASVRVDGKAGPQWTYIDKQGRELFPPKYAEARDFKNGFAVVGHFAEAVKTGFKVSLPRYSYINTTGQELAPVQYDKAGEFSEGYARVKRFDGAEQTKINPSTTRVTLAGRWTYLDRQGREILPAQYEDAEDFSEGYAAVGIGNKWTYINPQGQELFPPRYGELSPFLNGLAVTYHSALWRFIDKQGKEIFTLAADEVLPPSEGFAPIKIEGKWTYLKVPENPEAIPANPTTPAYQGHFKVFVETEMTTTGMASVDYDFQIFKDKALLTTRTYHEPIQCNGEYKTVEKNGTLELYYEGTEDNCRASGASFTIKKQDRAYHILGVGGEHGLPLSKVN